GGLPTSGWSWSVAVGPNREIANANGWLAAPEQGDDYPLAGVDAGLKRLKENPYGPGPVPLGAAREQLMPECVAPDCASPTPLVRTITGVRLGLLFAPLAGGASPDRTLLVPAYLFDIKDGGTIPVLAVADEFLPKPAPVEPTPKPEPAPAPEPSGGAC